MSRFVRNVMIITLVLMMFVLALQTAALDVPDTGQTYDTTATFGEDSDYTHNSQSYTKLGDGGVALPDSATDWLMVRDNVTGLIWEAKTDDGSVRDKDNPYTWDTAQSVLVQTLNDTNFGGFNDWRLPDVKELYYLTNIDRRNPAIDTTFFPNTYNSYHWTSNTCAEYSGMAWRVNFIASWPTTASKSNSLHARAVRGPIGVTQNLIDNGDGTVTDTSTGLMWQQATGATCTWEEALVYCENLTLAGHDDWRMPNAHEVVSVADHSTHSPAINTSFFPETYYSDSGNDWYWTSTSRQYSPDVDAWVIWFRRGYVYYTDQSYIDNKYKTADFHVRAVRTASGPPPDTIMVTSPNSGETWLSGGTETITWSTTGTVGNVKIELSTDGGSSWTTLVVDTANDGMEDVSAPVVESTQCLVRVSEASDGNPIDTSNSDFTITATVPKSITVTYPNGAETWTVGATETVTWISTGPVGNVSIWITTDGSTWVILDGKTDTANDGTEDVIVPDAPGSTQCRVIVSENGDDTEDWTDGWFSIVAGSDITPPTVSVTSIVIDGSASDMEYDPPIVTVAGINLGQAAAFSHEVTLTGSPITVTAEDTTNTTTINLDVTVP